MRKFFKSLLALVSGVICFIGIAYLQMMENSTVGFAGAVVLPLVFGMMFKTSGKYGLLTYPVLIFIPIIAGLGLFAYQLEASGLLIFGPPAIISALLGNYIRYHGDGFLSQKSLSIIGTYAFSCILILLTILPQIHILDISERVDEPLPDAELTTVDGDTVSVSNMEADIIVIDFWATWCGKCIAMMPELEQLDEMYNENPDVRVMAINTNQGDSFDDVKEFVSERDVEIDVLFDEESRFTEKMGVGGVPYTAIIDVEDNKVKVRKHGYAPGEDYVGLISKHIDRLLENSNEA